MHFKENCKIHPEDIFQCDMCGDCCKGFGGTYVNEEEITNISNFLNIDSAFFIKKYCQVTRLGTVLAQKEDGYCIFWDKECSIHSVKPHMCKAWPFIEAVVIDISNWRIMANACPGIRADFPEGVIVSCVRQVIADRKK
jgi:uncharacterized protein